ncbi:MAG: hypothetical protein IKK38_04940 [Spirochaetaceae bacterium]|nr:hypothetical protein [Spirochaetaceae bacterium]
MNNVNDSIKKPSFFDKLKSPKFWIGFVFWLLVIGFIAYIGYRLANVGKIADTVLERFEYLKEGQPEKYVLENDDLRFELDPDTTVFSVTQKSTGHVWYSNPVDSQNDKFALQKEKDNMRSPFLLKYSTINGVDTSYDFFNYSISKEAYRIKQTGDEITIDYSIGDIERVYVYPMALTEKDMNGYLEKFSASEQRSIKQNYRKLELGSLLASDDKNQLLQQYPMLKDEPVYVIRDPLQTFLKEKNEKMFASIGYTREDYDRDILMYAGGKIKNVPGFNISVTYKLDGNNLVVKVPFDKISYKRDFPIIRLSILPYFGAGGKDDKGFMLVPEGGGSIINFNNGKTRQNAYYCDIYGWDYGTDRDAVMTETRAAFPVFGIANGDSSFISIMQKGAEYGAVSADVAGKLGSYNYVFADYKMLHGEKYEPSSRNINTQYAYERGLPEGEYIEQIYSFIDSNSYAEMAKHYRKYLFGDAANASVKSVPVSVEIVGAISKTQQVFGMPKLLPYQLTSYKQAAGIIKSIDEMNIPSCYIKLTGFINSGVKQKSLQKFKLIKQLGGASAFDKMIEETKNCSPKLYLDGQVQYAFLPGANDGFNHFSHASRFASSEVCELSEYSPIWYGKRDTVAYYYLLKPEISKKAALNLCNNASKHNLSGISFRDDGYQLSADYNPKKKVSRAAVKDIQLETFKEIEKSGLGIMINAGNVYAVKDADCVTNMTFHGNDYAILDKHVPFYQIALHGNVTFTGSSINIANEIQQNILESAECGAGLAFTFFAESERRLQETDFTEYYASNFDNWQKKMNDIYSRYNSEMKSVCNARIDNHEFISDDVTLTTFDNGYSVLVNFGYVDFTTPDGVLISARDYKVMEAR